MLFDASFRCSNVLLYLIIRNTDYAQTDPLQFFIAKGVCEMSDLIGQSSSFEMRAISFPLSFLVCCSHIICGPLFDYRWRKGIPETLLS